MGSAGQLIALRSFMGLGAALAMPPTLSIIADVFPENERPKAIALWSMVSALGIVVGPILGGFLIERFPWPTVFVINVPVIVVGIVAALRIIPESKAPGRNPLDPIGAAFSVVALVGLTYGIIEGPANGWTAPAELALFGFSTPNAHLDAVATRLGDLGQLNKTDYQQACHRARGRTDRE